MDRPESASAPSPYPNSWEDVAELRVFRTTPERWQKLFRWRADMRRHGWKLLQVGQVAAELVAVFGRTRPELLQRQAAGR